MLGWKVCDTTPALATVLMLLHSAFSSNHFTHRFIWGVSFSLCPHFCFLFSFESQSLFLSTWGGVVSSFLFLLSYHGKSFSEWRNTASRGNPWQNLGNWGEWLGWNVPSASSSLWHMLWPLCASETWSIQWKQQYSNGENHFPVSETCVPFHQDPLHLTSHIHPCSVPLEA